MTAALPTDPPRRGADQIYVALCTEGSQVLWSATLEPGRHTRDSAESIADQMIYLALAELCEATLPVPRSLLDPGVSLVTRR